LYFEKTVSYTLLFTCLMILSAVCMLNFSFGSASSSSLAFSITTEYYGANSKEIERVITMPLEDGIGDIPGIKKIQSTSEYGKSRIMVLAKANSDMNLLYTDIRERVDRVRAGFPKAVQKTQIVSSDNANHPVYIVSFKSEVLGLSELGNYVDTEIKPKYQRIRGTGEIETGGLGVQDILVSIDNGMATQYGIDPFVVSQTLHDAYIRMPTGSLCNGMVSTPIFFDSEVNDIDDFKTFEIRSKDGASVKLSEIAEITRQTRTSEQISRIDGEKRIILYIYSGGSVNTLALCDNLAKVTKSITDRGLNGEVIYSKGSEIKDSINKILISMVISMISLFLFIGLFIPDIKSRVILSASIPLSIFLGISALSALKIPVDASIISGLMIGSGLIIDNYLIIYDFIRKNREKPIHEIAMPLLSGTLTTLIVFLPLITLKSMSPDIQSISFSICGMLIISQLMTFTFLPHPLRLSCNSTSAKKPIISFETVARPFFSLTRFSQLHRPMLKIIYSLIILSVPFFLFFGQKEFTPIDNDSVLFVHVEFPSGTTIEEVDRVIAPYIKQFKETSYVRLVESNSKRGNAQISVTFDNSKSNIHDLQNKLEKLTERTHKGQFFYGIDQNTGTYKICFTLTGNDHETLREKAKDIGAYYSKQTWVTGVIYHFKENPPAYMYIPDTNRFSGFSLYPDKAASILRWNVQGPVALKWIEKQKEHDVRIKCKASIVSLPDLELLPVVMNGTSPASLGGLGHFIQREEPDRLYRENRQNSISFTVQTKRIGLNAINEKINESIKSQSLPTGYGIFPDSSISDSLKNYKTMYLVFLLAVFLIYALLAIQNESFILPLLIISAIPFSAFFPLLFLLIVQKPITSASIIGMIILSGTSVNNFILIMDTMQNSTEEGEILERVTNALQRRFNPLFLSCGTSIIAAIPILFSSKPFSDFPSALAIIITLGITGSFIGSFLFLPALIDLFLGSAENNCDSKSKE